MVNVLLILVFLNGVAQDLVKRLLSSVTSHSDIPFSLVTGSMAPDFISKFFARGRSALGRITYQMMESAWREPAETGKRADWMEEWMMPFARTINATKKFVVSDSLSKVTWNSEMVRGNELEKKIRQLKQQPGKGLYVGGVQLPLALAKLGLIDEFEFIVHPAIAGHGPAPFAGLPQLLELKFMGLKEFRSGAVAMKYGLASQS